MSKGLPLPCLDCAGAYAEDNHYTDNHMRCVVHISKVATGTTTDRNLQLGLTQKFWSCAHMHGKQAA